MKKKLIVIILVAAIILFIIAIGTRTIVGNFLKIDKSSNNTVSGSIEETIAKNPIIRDIPLGRKILLKTYTLNSGQKQYETAYIIERGSVEQGSIKGADVVFEIPLQYLTGLTNDNLCSKTSEAVNSGEISFSSKHSEIGLLWIFKGIIVKYGKCLGI